jgi:DNA-binding winged helix-turn-helix (wHTH) protein
MKTPWIFPSSMDVSDLYPRPLTLRTLLHSLRKDNTRAVNNRCIFHELARRSNRLKELYLFAAAGSLPARPPGAIALPTAPIPFRSPPAICYIPKHQENMANSPIPDESRRMRFGPFSVDLRAGELYKRGKKIKVQLLPLQLLGALLEKPGELVSREELKSRLWPADTFVDFEHGLNTAIKKLRQALGDNPAKPGLIETLPKKGYRFIGRLESNGASVPKNPSPKTALAGKIFSVFAEDGIACVVAPVDAISRDEWQRLIALGDDVGVSMMIAQNRLLLIEVGKPVRVLSADGPQGWLEARILEGEHYGKTALLPRKSLRTT